MATTLYKGLKFPFSKGTASVPAASSDSDLIKESLRQIILTAKGERVMRPDFGTNAMAMLFENNNELLGHMLELEIRSAITKFEPRVIMQELTGERKESEIILTISYVVISTAVEDSLSITLPTA